MEQVIASVKIAMVLAELLIAIFPVFVIIAEMALLFVNVEVYMLQMVQVSAVKEIIGFKID
jgi:hypothetical protein